MIKYHVLPKIYNSTKKDNLPNTTLTKKRMTVTVKSNILVSKTAQGS